MKKDSLNVAEMFFSIQGEGPSTGCPAVFLRLSGCNLLCKGDWICDTIDVWKHSANMSFEDILASEAFKGIRDNKLTHLVITGGEPLLQQKALVDFIYYIHAHGYFPDLEIETNGTIPPVPELYSLPIQWNVSPKLKGAGPKATDIFPHGMDRFLTLLAHGRNVYFKFVVTDRSDMYEIKQRFNTPPYRTILMPGAATQEELDTLRIPVIELCKEFGYRYTDRLHIVTWNKKTGV